MDGAQAIQLQQDARGEGRGAAPPQVESGWRRSYEAEPPQTGHDLCASDEAQVSAVRTASPNSSCWTRGILRCTRRERADLRAGMDAAGQAPTALLDRGGFSGSYRHAPRLAADAERARVRVRRAVGFVCSFYWHSGFQDAEISCAGEPPRSAPELTATARRG
ncbi:hypothetical protein NDU88_005548 [Pleurodeles waltl]|uniref:Uncharacterized protein n=1 Tax=Pleurodeles waltl TaxID=8319 RepID=A0AAV7RP87_PLEWA|nr:hypothetical protein NDU88_005548 [Pleurodeles waltl]